MACMERSSISARLSSLGSSWFMLNPCRVGCVHQDDTPTGALTDAERTRNRGTVLRPSPIGRRPPYPSQSTYFLVPLSLASVAGPVTLSLACVAVSATV